MVTGKGKVEDNRSDGQDSDKLSDGDQMMEDDQDDIFDDPSMFLQQNYLFLFDNVMHFSKREQLSNHIKSG